MPDQEVLDLGRWLDPVVAENAALFLWATGPRLDLAVKVISAWGFRYATIAFAWAKQNANGGMFAGPGYYSASNCGRNPVVSPRRAQRGRGCRRFRKTALQHARRGEDLNRLVAQDAKVTTSVMMRHYVSEHEEELRHASNRTYARILASLPTEVATRYGYQPVNGTADLEARLDAALKAKDWLLVADLANRLGKDRPVPPI